MNFFVQRFKRYLMAAKPRKDELITTGIVAGGVLLYLESMSWVGQKTGSEWFIIFATPTLMIIAAITFIVGHLKEGKQQLQAVARAMLYCVFGLAIALSVHFALISLFM